MIDKLFGSRFYVFVSHLNSRVAKGIHWLANRLPHCVCALAEFRKMFAKHVRARVCVSPLCGRTGGHEVEPQVAEIDRRELDSIRRPVRAPCSTQEPHRALQRVRVGRRISCFLKMSEIDSFAKCASSNDTLTHRCQ